MSTRAFLGLLTAATLALGGCGEHHGDHGEAVPSKPMPMSGQLKPLGDSLGVPPGPVGRVQPRGPGLYFQPGSTQPGAIGIDLKAIDGEPE